MRARIMIVGMAPGSKEDAVGRPFVGPAGMVLESALAAAGIKREEVYLTNAVKCFPGPTKVGRTHLAECTERYLKYEIEFIRPELIIALGDVAMLATTNRSGVKANRGKVLELRPGLAPGGRSIPVLVTYHPAAFLHSGRDPNIGRAIRADIARAKAILNGELRQLIVTRSDEVLSAPVAAVDVETDRNGNFILGTVATDDGKYYPFYPHDIREVFERVAARKLLFWNAKFDLRVLGQHGVQIDQDRVVDVMLVLHLLDSGRQGRYSLEAAVLDEWGWADEQWVASKRRVHGGAEVPHDELLRYCAQDAVYTAKLYTVYSERIAGFPRLKVLYRTLVRPALHLLKQVEETPVPLDIEYLKVLDEELRAASSKVAAEMASLAGLSEVPNFRSNRVLVEVMYNKLGLSVVRLTDSGAPSTSKAVLFELADFSPFVQSLIRYRKINKLHSAYVKRWLQRYSDAPYYALYNLHGTVSGRLSSDFQQVPRPSDDPELPNIRNAIAAPEGFLILEADYSMLELRLIAWRAREENLLRLIREGADVHRHTASLLFGVPEEEVTKVMRHVGKTANFSLGYGASPAKLAEIMRLGMTTEQINETCKLLVRRGLQDAAEAIHAAWHEAYPMIRLWHRREGKRILDNGAAVAPHGRIRWLHKAKAGTKHEKAEAIREGCNHVIQSLASDLTLLAAVRAAPEMHRAGSMGPWPTHDSLMWIVPVSEAYRLAAYLKAVMEGVTEAAREAWGIDIDVPLVAEVKLGNRWGSVERLQELG